MNNMPYKDKSGNEYRYGEFYPIELSPFGYNETYAPELQTITKQEAGTRGYGWQENMQRTKGKETLLPEKIPDSINEVEDSILEEVLRCTECERNYKIVQNELIFYRKLKIPVPRKCFYCRYQARLLRTKPLKLWHRTCMCKKNNHPNHLDIGCPSGFETSYAPERPEIVYCEKCYQAEVY